MLELYYLKEADSVCSNRFAMFVIELMPGAVVVVAVIVIAVAVVDFLFFFFVAPQVFVFVRFRVRIPRIQFCLRRTHMCTTTSWN